MGSVLHLAKEHQSTQQKNTHLGAMFSRKNRKPFCFDVFYNLFLAYKTFFKTRSVDMQNRDNESFFSLKLNVSYVATAFMFVK
jgi:hypothetical protein